MGNKGKLVEPAQELFEPILLQAKLDIPALPFHPVNRSGLDRCLDEGTTGKCTAVIAPAGFGKTVGVAQWLRKKNIAAAWVTLDPADNSPPRFWYYLLTALGRFPFGNGSSSNNNSVSSDPVTAGHIQPFLQANSIADLEEALPQFIQQLGTSNANMFLILDDYYLIKEPKIHKTLYYFVRYVPQNIRIILISRTQPPLSLFKSKLGMDYQEIGVKDLYFSEDEVAAYCRLIGIKLSPAQRKVLLFRTGGWPVGLSFAAEYIEQGGFAAFEELFRGDNRVIGAYLEEEVYAAWPQDVQKFLLHTAVLDSFTGPSVTHSWTAEAVPPCSAVLPPPALLLRCSIQKRAGTAVPPCFFNTCEDA